MNNQKNFSTKTKAPDLDHIPTMGEEIDALVEEYFEQYQLNKESGIDFVRKEPAAYATLHFRNKLFIYEKALEDLEKKIERDQND